MRWRLGASLLTVLTATVAVATAVLGPMYEHTAGDSVLRRTVASAAVQNRGITLIPRASQPLSPVTMQRAAGLVEQTAGAHRRHGAEITTVQVGAGITQLLWRTGICAHIGVVRGRCDLGAGDTVVTQAYARQFHEKPGSAIDVPIVDRTTPLRLTVTGIAAGPAINAPYWWGDGGSDFPLEVHNAPPSKLKDSLVVSEATALAVPAKALPTVSEQIPLHRDAIDLGDESAMRAIVARDTRTLSGRGITLGTDLPAVLDGADHQRHVMATIVAIAATQLVLLAVWVLGSLLVRSSDARRSEARVARLRGFTAASMLWVTAVEPALLCLLGAVLGVALAWVAILVSRAQLFLPASSISFDAWTFVALGLTLAAIVGALGIGTVRLLRSAELAQGPTRTPRAASITGIVADVVLLVLAVVALVALGTTGALSGRTDPIASAAPGLIALGTAVLAVHAILFACRIGIRVTEGSPRVAAFLALRQTVRRPGVLRQARVLVIALCLACFATAAWAVARGNRATAAEFQIGAHTVLTVAPTSVSRLQAAVDRADPHGRFAMAAVDLHTSSTTLLAVDASRMTAVASWPGGISRRSLREVRQALDPHTTPPVHLADADVQVIARTQARGAVSSRLGHLVLEMWVFTPSGGTGIARLGTLRPGRAEYRADLSGLCGGGCRLTGLGVVPQGGAAVPATGALTLTVDGLTNGRGRAPASADLVPGGWRTNTADVRDVAQPADGLTLSIGATALANAANATGSLQSPMASPADHPKVLPGVATTELRALNMQGSGPINAEGLDGSAVGVRPVGTASALPRIGADGVMVDLTLLSRAQVQPTSALVTDEVWLGPHAPFRAVDRLRAAGLRITGDARSSTVFDRLQGTGPALADDFLLVATIAALLVAMASTLGALGATTRERATELASLEVAGVSRPTLVYSLGLEAAILLLTAVCGVGGGVLAAVLAVPSLPELASATLTPLDYALPAGLIAAVALAVIVAVAVAAAAVDGTLVRRISPLLLRTAPDDISG
jgi:putative ABC transport system permease protein